MKTQSQTPPCPRDSLVNRGFRTELPCSVLGQNLHTQSIHGKKEAHAVQGGEAIDV